MTHAELVERAARWLRNTRRCSVVLTERYVSTEMIEIPDAIGWTRRGHSIVVECKASRGDMRADLLKPCRRREPEFGLGRVRYYLTEPGLIHDFEEVSKGWGLLEAYPERIKKVRDADARGYNRDLEMAMLVSELSRYQMHGITYPPLVVAPMPSLDERTLNGE